MTTQSETEDTRPRGTVVLGNGVTVDLTTCTRLGKAFTSAVRSVVNLTAEQYDRLHDIDVRIARSEFLNENSDDLYEGMLDTLIAANLGWSPSFDGENCVEATPYITAIQEDVSQVAANFVCAVLLRDLGLILQREFEYAVMPYVLATGVEVPEVRCCVPHWPTTVYDVSTRATLIQKHNRTNAWPFTLNNCVGLRTSARTCSCASTDKVAS